MTHLTYQGDVSVSVIGQIMGPDIYGGLSEAVDAEYFPLADITRVKFAPIYVTDPREVELDEFGQLRVVS